MPRNSDPTRTRESQLLRERLALERLARLREELLRELEAIRRDPEYREDDEPHRSCLRELNQMRISPLEALAIARAFRNIPALRARLPGVLRRLGRELGGLEDNTERQNFDCPLLERGLCLVHRAAKPIGCLAWNPGKSFTKKGWSAFAERDVLNDGLYGPQWKLRVIPLWLERVLRTGRKSN